MKFAKTGTLTERIYHSLRQAILSGQLQQGDRLKETSLARDFNVSPTPIREALMKLSQDGFIRIDHYRGATVASYSARDFENLYQIRMLLEIPAIRMAVKQISEQDIQHLQQILNSGDEALQNEDFSTLEQLDLDFHEALVAYTGNPYLARITRNNHEKIRSIRRIVAHLSVVGARSQHEHHRILEAVAARDADLAESGLRQHIETTTKEILHDLNESEPTT